MKVALPLKRRQLLACAVLPVLPATVAATPPPPVPAAARASDPTGDWADEPLTVGSAKRRYRLLVPRSLRLNPSIPLVIALHGMGKDSKDVFARFTGLSDSAERNDFAIAYLQAERAGWGQQGAALKADLDALDALLVALQERLPLAPGRVHLVGFSSGARLALRAAAERPGRYASLVVHSPLPGPAPTVRMPPQLWIHGERDLLVPVAGVRAAVNAANAARQRVQLVTVPDLGHQWASGRDMTQRIWGFQMLQTANVR